MEIQWEDYIQIIPTYSSFEYDKIMIGFTTKSVLATVYEKEVYTSHSFNITVQKVKGLTDQASKNVLLAKPDKLDEKIKNLNKRIELDRQKFEKIFEKIKIAYLEICCNERSEPTIEYDIVEIT